MKQMNDEQLQIVKKMIDNGKIDNKNHKLSAYNAVYYANRSSLPYIILLLVFVVATIVVSYFLFDNYFINQGVLADKTTFVLLAEAFLIPIVSVLLGLFFNNRKHSDYYYKKVAVVYHPSTEKTTTTYNFEIAELTTDGQIKTSHFQTKRLMGRHDKKYIDSVNVAYAIKDTDTNELLFIDIDAAQEA